MKPMPGRLRRSVSRIVPAAVAMAAVNLLAVFGISSAHAVGGGGFQGKFENLCNYTHSLPDDPIVFPNKPGASHLHDFIANPSTNAASTVQSLQAATPSCFDTKDFAGYWVPTMLNGTTQIHPSSVTVYYLTNGKTNVKPYPLGLEELAGNSHATSASQEHDVLWGCSTTAPTLPQAPTCASGDELHARIQFPDCWDGVHLDSPDHVSHVAYSSNFTCPSAFPVPLPMLSVLVKYPTNGGPGITLSSGPTYTQHADFYNAWDPAELQRLVTTCLDAGVDCGRPV